jgi:extradiol dioxygenase family protein
MGLVQCASLNLSTRPLVQRKSTMIEVKTNPTMMSPFHLAFPVDDLAKTRSFYGELLGCPEGRSSEEWIDFNFYGHQIVAHLAPSECGLGQRNAVDGHGVPVRHFGIVLPLADWNAMSDRLRAAGIKFIIEPYTRFKGEAGEQSTMFFLDPAGNALEIKAFGNIDRLFAK